MLHIFTVGAVGNVQVALQDLQVETNVGDTACALTLKHVFGDLS